MERPYQNNKVSSEVKIFTGIEVEKTPAYEMKTLFVVDCHNGKEIAKLSRAHGCDHIYFGANQSFDLKKEGNSVEDWENMINECLKEDFWCTLDFDVSVIEDVLELGFDQYHKYIPQVSVKIPYLKLLNYNASIKIDDKDFKSTNPGVWCVPLLELTKKKYYTNWDQYKNDEIVK
jgi:hypothetical protein